MAQVKGGKARAIAVTTAQRGNLAPDLPTMAEAGLPEFDISTWFGILAPAGHRPMSLRSGTPTWSDALNAPDVREKMLAQGAEPAPTTPAEFAAFIARERDKYARIVKASGAKID